MLAEHLGSRGAAFVIAVQEASEKGIDLLPDVILSETSGELNAWILEEKTRSSLKDKARNEIENQSQP